MKLLGKILTIALVVLVVAQLALMFLPYFRFTPAQTLDLPNPVETDYSLQDFTWTKIQEMEKTIKDVAKNELGVKSKDYSINPYAHPLVLTFVTGILVLICSLFFYNKLGAQVVNVLWGVFGVFNFATNQILHTSIVANEWIATVSLVLCIVGLLVAIGRAVIYTITTIEETKRRRRIMLGL